jgi:hypothetical protein
LGWAREHHRANQLEHLGLVDHEGVAARLHPDRRAVDVALGAFDQIALADQRDVPGGGDPGLGPVQGQHRTT